MKSMQLRRFPAVTALCAALIGSPISAQAGDITIRLDQASSFAIIAPDGTSRLFQLNQSQDDPSSGLVVISITAVSPGDGGPAGFLSTLGPNKEDNTRLTSLVGNQNHGFIAAHDTFERLRAGLYVDSAGNGHMDLYNTLDDAVITLRGLPSGEGNGELRGPNGQDNVRLTSLASNPNHGAVTIQDTNGNTRAGMIVNSSGFGELFADLKAFIEEYPGQPGDQIAYISLEGPEAAMFYRGKMPLVNGRATIALPEHFTALAAMETLSVQLTPHSLDSLGVGVAGIEGDRIEVGELYGGSGTYEVSFVVHATRARFIDHQPVVKNSARSSFNAELRREARYDKKLAEELDWEGVAQDSDNLSVGQPH